MTLPPGFSSDIPLRDVVMILNLQSLSGQLILDSLTQGIKSRMFNNLIERDAVVRRESGLD